MVPALKIRMIDDKGLLVMGAIVSLIKHRRIYVFEFYVRKRHYFQTPYYKR